MRNPHRNSRCERPTVVSKSDNSDIAHNTIPMNQEAKTSNSNCPQDRDKHLEHVLFNWKVLDHNKAFEQRCRDVVTFKIEFGHCIILEFLSRSFVGGVAFFTNYLSFILYSPPHVLVFLFTANTPILLLSNFNDQCSVSFVASAISNQSSLWQHRLLELSA